MEALDLFHQNFAVAESLIQLYQLFEGLNRADLSSELHLAVCAHWKAPENSHVAHMSNSKVSVLARTAAQVPPSMTTEHGLDFLLRQAVVVGCTSVESFFWDVLRENVPTVILARKTRADDAIKNITLTVGDYISVQQYDDPDFRLRQIILKKFERGTLYNIESIDTIARILTVRDFWTAVEKACGEKSATFKRLVADLIARRNHVAHRADRPPDEEEIDAHGLRPITLSWTIAHLNAAKTLVTAGAEVIDETIKQLKLDIQTARDQEEARKLSKILAEKSQNTATTDQANSTTDSAVDSSTTITSSTESTALKNPTSTEESGQ